MTRPISIEYDHTRKPDGTFRHKRVMIGDTFSDLTGAMNGIRRLLEGPGAKGRGADFEAEFRILRHGKRIRTVTSRGVGRSAEIEEAAVDTETAGRKARVTFGRTENHMGDKHVEIFIDGKRAGSMQKAYDGPEWYTYGDEHPSLYDNDLGTTLNEAKREIKRMVAEASTASVAEGDEETAAGKARWVKSGMYHYDLVNANNMIVGGIEKHRSGYMGKVAVNPTHVGATSVSWKIGENMGGMHKRLDNAKRAVEKKTGVKVVTASVEGDEETAARRKAAANKARWVKSTQQHYYLVKPDNKVIGAVAKVWKTYEAWTTEPTDYEMSSYPTKKRLGKDFRRLDEAKRAVEKALRIKITASVEEGEEETANLDPLRETRRIIDILQDMEKEGTSAKEIIQLLVGGDLNKRWPGHDSHFDYVVKRQGKVEAKRILEKVIFSSEQVARDKLSYDTKRALYRILEMPFFANIDTASADEETASMPEDMYLKFDKGRSRGVAYVVSVFAQDDIAVIGSLMDPERGKMRFTDDGAKNVNATLDAFEVFMEVADDLMRKTYRSTRDFEREAGKLFSKPHVQGILFEGDEASADEDSPDSWSPELSAWVESAINNADNPQTNGRMRKREDSDRIVASAFSSNAVSNYTASHKTREPKLAEMQVRQLDREIKDVATEVASATGVSLYSSADELNDGDVAKVAAAVRKLHAQHGETAARVTTITGSYLARDLFNKLSDLGRKTSRMDLDDLIREATETIDDFPAKARRMLLSNNRMVVELRKLWGENIIDYLEDTASVEEGKEGDEETAARRKARWMDGAYGLEMLLVAGRVVGTVNKLGGNRYDARTTEPTRVNLSNIVADLTAGRVMFPTDEHLGRFPKPDKAKEAVEKAAGVRATASAEDDGDEETAAALSPKARQFFDMRFQASNILGSMRRMLESELVLPIQVEETVKAMFKLNTALIYASPKEEKLARFLKMATTAARDLEKALTARWGGPSRTSAEGDEETALAAFREFREEQSGDSVEETAIAANVRRKGRKGYRYDITTMHGEGKTIHTLTETKADDDGDWQAIHSWNAKDMQLRTAQRIADGMNKDAGVETASAKEETAASRELKQLVDKILRMDLRGDRGLKRATDMFEHEPELIHELLNGEDQDQWDRIRRKFGDGTADYLLNDLTDLM